MSQEVVCERNEASGLSSVRLRVQTVGLPVNLVLGMVVPSSSGSGLHDACTSFQGARHRRGINLGDQHCESRLLVARRGDAC